MKFDKSGFDETPFDGKSVFAVSLLAQTERVRKEPEIADLQTERVIKELEIAVLQTQRDRKELEIADLQTERVRKEPEIADLQTERYLIKPSSGTRISKPYDVGLDRPVESSFIEWISYEYPDASVNIYTAVTSDTTQPSSSEWTQREQNGKVIENGTDMRDKYLWFKQELVSDTGENNPELVYINAGVNEVYQLTILCQTERQSIVKNKENFQTQRDIIEEIFTNGQTERLNKEQEPIKAQSSRWLKTGYGSRISKPYHITTGTVLKSNVKWSSNEPGTSKINIYRAITSDTTVPSSSDWVEVTNDSNLVPSGNTYNDNYLWFKQEIDRSDDITNDPELISLEAYIDDRRLEIISAQTERYLYGKDLIEAQTKRVAKYFEEALAQTERLTKKKEIINSQTFRKLIEESTLETQTERLLFGQYLLHCQTERMTFGEIIKKYQTSRILKTFIELLLQTERNLIEEAVEAILAQTERFLYGQDTINGQTERKLSLIDKFSLQTDRVDILFEKVSGQTERITKKLKNIYGQTKRKLNEKVHINLQSERITKLKDKLKNQTERLLPLKELMKIQTYILLKLKEIIQNQTERVTKESEEILLQTNIIYKIKRILQGQTDRILLKEENEFIDLLGQSERYLRWIYQDISDLEWNWKRLGADIDWEQIGYDIDWKRLDVQIKMEKDENIDYKVERSGYNIEWEKDEETDFDEEEEGYDITSKVEDATIEVARSGYDIVIEKLNDIKFKWRKK